MKNMFKLIYWTVMPLTIGFFLFLYIDKMEISIIYKVLIFLAIVIPVATMRVWIGVKIFKEKPTLAEKIMSCNLRRKYGRDYCAKCPDGYKCCEEVYKGSNKE